MLLQRLKRAIYKIETKCLALYLTCRTSQREVSVLQTDASGESAPETRTNGKGFTTKLGNGQGNFEKVGESEKRQSCCILSQIELAGYSHLPVLSSGLQVLIQVLSTKSEESRLHHAVSLGVVLLPSSCPWLLSTLLK